MGGCWTYGLRYVVQMSSLDDPDVVVSANEFFSDSSDSILSDELE